MIGFRPELWREAAPGDAPADVTGFNRDAAGIEGFRMPATQHDVTQGAITALKVATVADEKGEIDPSFVVTDRMPLTEAPQGWPGRSPAPTCATFEERRRELPRCR